jgi:pSer/pThr/pTyr-binding forkhead associated (FHA) protein
VPNLKISDKKRDFVHQIEGDVVTIGRGDTNTIAIEDSKASKEHCRIERDGDRWKVVDLESKNGTRVNGEFCNKAWLKHGDTILIGTAEIRFGVEGKQRAAAAGKRRPAAAAAPVRARDRAAEEYDDEDEGPPPSRYGRDDSTEKLIKWGSFLVGGVLIVLFTSLWINRTTGDPYNEALLEQADRLAAEGRFEEAIAHLENNGDTSGNAYYLVLQRLKELRDRAPLVRSDQREQEASRILSRLGLKIRGYHMGKTQTTSPEEILQLVERLKTEYADTEKTELARRQYPLWFKGQVPPRASDIVSSGGKLRKDWKETVARADEYRKAWQFREARETIQAFITTREAILDETDRAYYKAEVERQLGVIDGLADSIYRGRERLCRDLVKNRRYDEAIKRMQEVVEKYGIDLYVRKAQAKIEEYKKLKAENK